MFTLEFTFFNFRNIRGMWGCEDGNYRYQTLLIITDFLGHFLGQEKCGSLSHIP